MPDTTGEDLAGEDATFMQHLAENGRVGDVGEADATQSIDLVMRSRSGGSCVGDERTQHQEDFQIRKLPQFI